MDSLFANYGSDDDADDEVPQTGKEGPNGASASGGVSQGRGFLVSPLQPAKQAGPVAGGTGAVGAGPVAAGKPGARSFLSSLPPPRSGAAAPSSAGLQGPSRPSHLPDASSDEDEDVDEGPRAPDDGVPKRYPALQERGVQTAAAAADAGRKPAGLLSSLPAPGGGLSGLLSNLPAPRSKGISDMLPQVQRSTTGGAAGPGASGSAGRGGKAGGLRPGLAGQGMQKEPETGKKQLVSFTLPLNMSLLKGGAGEGAEDEEEEEEERARKKRQRSAAAASAAKGKSGLAALLPPPQSEKALGGGHALGAGDGDGGWGGGGGGGARLMLDDDDDDDEGDVVADALTSMPLSGGIAGPRAGTGSGLTPSPIPASRGGSQASLATRAVPVQHTSNEAFRVTDVSPAAPGPGAEAARPSADSGMPAAHHQGYSYTNQGQARGMPQAYAHQQEQWVNHQQQHQHQHQQHQQQWQWQAPGAPAPYDASAAGHYQQEYGYHVYGGQETQEGYYPSGGAGVPTAGQWAPEEDPKRPRQRWEQEAAAAAAAAETAAMGPGAKVVEVRQSELTGGRVREDQLRATGIAFGPSHQPVSSAKDKPDKMSRRKHQISALYFDMKAKEMEMAERRSKGMLSKAETQAKYGWS